MYENRDRVSELYRGEIWGAETQRIARDRVHWLVSQVNGTVLDVGCSQGIASILAGKAGFDVIGVDFEAEAIEYARAELQSAEGLMLGSVSFQEAHAANLPFEDDTFDVVLLGEVIEHLIQPSVVLAEARRVLKPEGRIAITTPYGYHPHHDHVQTFYAASVIATVAEIFAVDSVDIVDNYFRIVGRKGHQDPGFTDTILERLQPQVEALTLEIERSRAKVRDQHKRTTETLGKLEQRSEQAAEQARERSEAERALKEDLNAERVRATELATTRQAELDAVQRELDAVQRQLSAVREKSGQLASDRAKTARAKSAADRKSQTLARRNYKLECDRVRLRNRLAIQQWKLASMRERKWSRLGRAVGAALRRPWRLLVLPFDLISIVFSSSDLPPRPKPLPTPEPPAALAAGNRSPQQKTMSPSAGVHHGEPQFSIPELPMSQAAPNRPDLVVATVLDEFSEMLYQYEWQSVPITPSNWKATLEAQRPDLLFVESAWRGQNASWKGKIANHKGPGEPLIALTKWCNEQGIPTVFWNKEDPPNFDWFIGSATLFDHIFTVDADTVPRYKSVLGHDRIGILPFSAQPRVHNPIAMPGGRSREVAFAGSYHAAKHEKRREQMEFVLDPARKQGLEIFSRFDAAEYGDGYQWPEKYHSHIVGHLPYERILSAVKMYKVFLNVNSVTESPTMCARRVFELLAAGTPVVTGPSRAILETFPRSILPVTSAPKDTARELKAILGDSELRTRRGVTGIRAVLSEHTADDRVRTVLTTLGMEDEPRHQSVSMIAPTNRPNLVPAILKNAARQRYQDLELVMLLHGIDEATLSTDEVSGAAADLGLDNLQVLRVSQELPLGTVLNTGFEAASGDFIGRIDDDDYYAPEYLGDQIRAFSYADAEIIGKWTHYAYLAGSDITVLRFAGHEYTYRDLILGPTMLMKRAVFESVKFQPLPQGSDTAYLRDARAAGVSIFATDQLNFLYYRDSDPASHTYVKPDEYFLKQGTVMWDGRNPERISI